MRMMVSCISVEIDGFKIDLAGFSQGVRKPFQRGECRTHICIVINKMRVNKGSGDMDIVNLSFHECHNPGGVQCQR